MEYKVHHQPNKKSKRRELLVYTKCSKADVIWNV